MDEKEMEPSSLEALESSTISLEEVAPSSKDESTSVNPHKKSRRAVTIEKHDSGISLDTKLCANPSMSFDAECSSAAKDAVNNDPDTSIATRSLYGQAPSEQSSPDSGLQGEMSEAIGSFFSVYEEGAAELSELALPQSLEQETVLESDEGENVSHHSPEEADSDREETVRRSRVKKNSHSEESEEEETTMEIPQVDYDSEYDPTPKTNRPTHKWFVCKEVINRQYGQSRNLSYDLYQQRCCSSLHMVERLELMYKMDKHEGCVNALHFNTSGSKLATTGDDLRVIVWDWTLSDPVLIYDSGHRSNVFQVKFLPMSGDCHIVTCARDGQVRLAELSVTGVCKRTRKLAQHHGATHKLSLDPDSPHTFLSCGEDGVVFEIDVRVNKPEKLLYCKENESRLALYSIQTNPAKTFEFAIGGRDRYVRVYDKRFIQDSNSCRKYCPDHLVSSDSKANVTCLVYNHDGKEILATYNDDDIYTFDSNHSEGANYTHRYRGHRNNQTVKGVNYFGPKSEFIVSGSDCGNIYFWEHDSEHIVQFMSGDEGGVVNCLEPHPTCPILATSGLDDDIKIWVPSCEHPPLLKDLKGTICMNMKDREDDRNSDTHDAIDGQMLWFLMQQWRRSSRRRGRREVEDSSSESSNDEEEEDGHRNNIQCYQS